MGIAFLTETADLPEWLRPIVIEGQDLQRTVRLCDVAGRRRSLVASAFMKLLRSADLVDGDEARHSSSRGGQHLEELL